MIYNYIDIRYLARKNVGGISDEEFRARFSRIRSAVEGHIPGDARTPHAALFVDPSQLALMQDMEVMDVQDLGKGAVRFLAGTHHRVILSLEEDHDLNPLATPAPPDERTSQQKEEEAVDENTKRYLARKIAEAVAVLRA